MRKYAVILGNLGNTKDRFCGGYKDNPLSGEMLKKAAGIKGIKGIELVGTWDIRKDNVLEMKTTLDALGLDCISIIPDLFSDKIWQNGSLSSRNKVIRTKAMNYLREMCEIAVKMNCRIINLWLGQDGYDYPFQGYYLEDRQYLSENIAKIASEFPKLKFALEYKAKEPRTHSYLARMADTLLVCGQSGQQNVGVTIDVGHAFLGGENVSESVVMAKQAGNKLFHLHFNDNFRSWDDDMIVGAIHTIEYLELLFWLDECNYDGWFSMDQYPYREDAARAIQESIDWLKYFDDLLNDNRAKLRKAIHQGDAVSCSKLLRSVFKG